MEEKNKTNSKNTMLAVLIWIGLGVILYFILFSGKNDNSSDTSKDYKIDAYVMSQDFMEDYLKSPSTAKFPIYSAINVVQTGNRYKVEAYVDSQNSFGSTVRTKYYMILERSDNGGWTKISCDIK